ncbi:hypothetical protein [Mongoliitalea daihaiensis]|uniref:hypothetical protein n=1 Tax=Mongoliitalea daihaiensis TaxID=2782006 RepID=UPI001F381D4C|nr:hypothetical protein [Mongoliitalea daihaiensis]UJP64340.1 hypothetical protein IPZ59_16230 [Mongoliitalea daihaiensis]
MYYKIMRMGVSLMGLFVISMLSQGLLLEEFSVTDQDQRRQEYRLVVKVINDEWRVVIDGDDSRSDVTLRRGDRIRWVVEGSDASFAFPDQNIFGHETRVVKDGNPLTLAVSARSPRGTFAYTVFVHEGMTYARGQSPPRIIIRN